MSLHWNIGEIDDQEKTPEQLSKLYMNPPIEFIKDKLSKREAFAAMANVDIDGYSQSYAEAIIGEKHPGIENPKELITFWAKFKCYLKVLEADLLIEALNKQP